MSPQTDVPAFLAGTSKRMLGRLLALAENRLSLLLVEAEEERERFLCAILLVAGVMAFSLLAGIALTAAVIVLFWQHSPLVALLILVALYAGIAAWLYSRLQRLRAGWETLPETLDQLRKDRECIEKALS